MARRFGRNQKRRAREALHEALQQARTETSARLHSEALVRESRAKSDYLLSVINELTEALPRGFVGLPPAFVKTSQEPAYGEVMRMDVAPPAGLAPLSFCSTAEAVEYRVNELLTFIGTLHFDQIADKVHYMLEFTDGRLAYSASREAIMSMPRKRLEHLIAENLAKHFAKERPIKAGARR